MTKHEYICAICDVVRSKSNCAKRKVGAVFVNDDYEILATGYNGAPKGFDDCDAQSSFFTKNLDGSLTSGTCGNPCTRTIHAEQNAIAQAAKRGTSLRNSTVYCTYLPCITCARLLVQVGVKAVFVKESNEDGGLKVLSTAGIWADVWGSGGRR